MVYEYMVTYRLPTGELDTIVLEGVSDEHAREEAIAEGHYDIVKITRGEPMGYE